MKKKPVPMRVHVNLASPKEPTWAEMLKRAATDTSNAECETRLWAISHPSGSWNHASKTSLGDEFLVRLRGEWRGVSTPTGPLNFFVPNVRPKGWGRWDCIVEWPHLPDHRQKLSACSILDLVRHGFALD